MENPQDIQKAQEIAQLGQQLFQKGKLQKAYKKATENKPILDNIVKQTAQQSGGMYVTGLKDPDTAIKKITQKNEENPKRNYHLEDVNDLSRARLIYPTEDTMKAGLALLKQNLKGQKGIKIAKEDNYFAEPQDGYKGYHVDLELPNKQHAEIQLHTSNTYANSMVSHGEHAQFGDQQPKDVEKENETIANTMDALPPQVALAIGVKKAMDNAPQVLQAQQKAQMMGLLPIPSNNEVGNANNVLQTTKSLRTQPAGGGGQTINHLKVNTSLTETPFGVGGGGNVKQALSIVKQDPILNTKRDVPIRDVAGNKMTIPANEALTPHILSNNQVILKDDQEYRVNKSAYEQVMQNSIKQEKKEFAPELKQIEETQKGAYKSVAYINQLHQDYAAGRIGHLRYQQLLDRESLGSPDKVKYSQYTLPGGQNYREVLLRAPTGPLSMDYSKLYEKPTYRSPHWDEPNVLAHLRMNDRYIEQPGKPITSKRTVEPYMQNGQQRYKLFTNGKQIGDTHAGSREYLSHILANTTAQKPLKVLFLEELQSDWANEGRRRGFQQPEKRLTELPQGYRVQQINSVENGINTPRYRIINPQGNDEMGGTLRLNRQSAINEVLNSLNREADKGVPNNSLLKDWRGLALKRALKEAVDGKYDYLSWVNGKQTADRYNLAKYVDSIKWERGTNGDKRFVQIQPKDGNTIGMYVNSNNIVHTATQDQLNGKRLDEVIGKDHAETIMKKNKGQLLPKDLAIGGEWAHNLYDKEVPERLEDLTKQKIENLKVNLSGVNDFTNIPQEHINKLVNTQQALKITPQVKAVVQGQGGALKQPSGVMPSQYAPVNNAQQILQDQNRLRTEPAIGGEGGGGNRKNRFVNPMQGYLRPSSLMQPNPITAMNSTNYLGAFGAGGGGNTYSNALALMQAYQGDIKQKKGIGGYNNRVRTTDNKDFNAGGGGYNDKINTRDYGNNPFNSGGGGNIVQSAMGVLGNIGQGFGNTINNIAQSMQPKMASPIPEYNNLQDNPAFLNWLYHQGINSQEDVNQKSQPTQNNQQAVLGDQTQRQSVVPQAQADTVQNTGIDGFTTAPVPDDYAKLIKDSAVKYNLDPAVIASNLFSEHGFSRDPGWNKNTDGSYDRGPAQINTKAHPEISDQQALDPNFAIPYSAKLLRSYVDQTGSLEGGIAAYRIGAGGYNSNPNNPYGIEKINKVKAGLSPGLQNKLGFGKGGGGNIPSIGVNPALELLKRYPGIGGGGRYRSGYDRFLNTRQLGNSGSSI